MIFGFWLGFVNVTPSQLNDKYQNTRQCRCTRGNRAEFLQFLNFWPDLSIYILTAKCRIPKHQAMEVYKGMQRLSVPGDTRTYNLVLEMLTGQKRHAEALEVL